MKNKQSVLTGLLAVNAALSLGAYADAVQPAAGEQKNTQVIQSVGSEFEISFLNVTASCKVSHAAFDVVSVGLENISHDIIAIHAEGEIA